MSRIQDYPSVTPTASDNILIVQSQGQGLATVGSTIGAKMDKANPTGTGTFSLNRASGSTVGAYSVTLNEGNTASNNYSYAGGYNSTASGATAYAHGVSCTASGGRSNAIGTGTIANHLNQHVFGEYNAEDTSSAGGGQRGNYVEIVGKGTSNNARSNARTLDWSGNEVLAGGLTTGGDLSVGGKTDIVKTKTFSVTTNVLGEVDINDSNLGKMRSQCAIINAATDISTGNAIYADVGVYRASTRSWTIRFRYEDNTPVASQTFNATVYYILL